MTIHKSQGSEFAYTAMILPPIKQANQGINRQLVYTGITRGKRLVVLVGTPKALGMAVRNQEQSLRNTLLASRLRAQASHQPMAALL